MTTYLTGTGYEFDCPCCGKRLFLFHSAAGDIVVMPKDNIPKEDDDDEDQQDTGDD